MFIGGQVDASRQGHTNPSTRAHLTPLYMFIGGQDVALYNDYVYGDVEW